MLAMLCGIPGSGKSSLAHSIRLRLDNCGLVTFDDYEMRQEFWNEQSFSTSRGQAIERVTIAILESRSQATTTKRGNPILVDDTMHLRSMRHEIYKICRDNCLPMLVVWVNTDENIAATRNDYREPQKRVSTLSFQKIVDSFEQPVVAHVCDRFVVEVRNYGVDATEDEISMEKILSTIAVMLSNPMNYLPSPSCTVSHRVETMESQELTRNERKQLDEFLRNMVSKIIKAIKETDLTLVKVLGPKLAACKAEALQLLSITSVAARFPNIIMKHCTELSTEQQAIIAEVVTRVVDEISL